jgi:hypothetical protein
LVDRGLGRPGGPESPVTSLPIGQRRPIRHRPETDPVEGALTPVLGPDVADGGSVLPLVVADLDLAPATVPHAPSLSTLMTHGLGLGALSTLGISLSNTFSTFTSSSIQATSS